MLTSPQKMANINDLDPTIDKFLASIADQIPGYRHPSISFVSLVHDGYEVILRATLNLSPDIPTDLKPAVSVADLRAAQLHVPGAAASLRNLLQALLSDSGALIGNHTLRLCADGLQGYSAYYENAAQSRSHTRGYREWLSLSGSSPMVLTNPLQPSLDRALQSKAFDSLSDLLHEYGLEGFGHSDHTTFEIVANPVARIETSSRIQGDRLEVSVLVAADMALDTFQFTVRNSDRREDPNRRTFSRDDFAWVENSDARHGVATFPVAKGTVLDTRLFLAGHIHDASPLMDRSCLPNPRRRIVEIQDNGLERAIACLTLIKERDDKLRHDFENSVAVLFYLLGFETVRIGGNRKTTDGPDIYARAPGGELLVIEATSGAFDDEKLGKLVARAKHARERFEEYSPQQSVNKVTAVIVTPRTAEELGHNLSKAEKDDVLVLYRTELLAAIKRTEFAPDADATITGWRNAVTMRFLSNPRWD